VLGRSRSVTSEGTEIPVLAASSCCVRPAARRAALDQAPTGFPLCFLRATILSRPHTSLLDLSIIELGTACTGGKRNPLVWSGSGPVSPNRGKSGRRGGLAAASVSAGGRRFLAREPGPRGLDRYPLVADPYGIGISEGDDESSARPPLRESFPKSGELPLANLRSEGTGSARCLG